MSEILRVFSLTWFSLFARISDMIAWLLVLVVLKPLYLPRYKHMIPITILLLIGGFVVQLVVDAFSRNSIALFIAHCVLWNLVMLTVLLKGRVEHKVLQAVFLGTAWLQAIQISIAFSFVLQQMNIFVHHRILTLILYFFYLSFSLKNAPPTNRFLPRKYFYSLIIVSCIGTAICLSVPLVLQSMDAQSAALLILCGGGTLLIEAITLHLANQILLQGEKDATQILWHHQRAESATLANKASAFEEESRHLRHEISHTASLVTNMINNNEYDNALNILTSLQQNMESTRSPTSGNSIIDAVLETYRSKAETMGVIFNADICLSEDVSISSLDICSMLSNMLSNALEACVDCHNPFVHIDIYPVKRYLMIRVKNRVTHEVLDENPNLHTTKPNPVLHGNGTRIMRQICNKYQGMLDFEVKDMIFCVEAFLLLS